MKHPAITDFIFCDILAEGMGFEPTIRLTSYNGLAIRRLQPLGHPSALYAVRTAYAGVFLGGNRVVVKPPENIFFVLL